MERRGGGDETGNRSLSLSLSLSLPLPPFNALFPLFVALKKNPSTPDEKEGVPSREKSSVLGTFKGCHFWELWEDIFQVSPS